MVLAMLGFAIEDSLIRLTSVTIPFGQVLFLFGFGGALIFALFCKTQKKKLFIKEVLSTAMIIRMFFELIGRLFYSLSLTLMPISLVTLILQATPILVVAGAALIFREPVGTFRWIAIFVGLLGVIFILKPTGDGFSPYVLFAVLGMLGFAGRDLGSRAASPRLSDYHLGLYGFIAVMLAGILFSVWAGSAYVSFSVWTLTYILLLILVGCGSYFALMKAMRTGEVSFVTPFRYTRILFGVGAGILLFGEVLTIWLIVGSIIIILSGLFLFGSQTFTRGKAY
jgi:drug/metabolite transporter (DMT)-like permease